MRLLAGFLYGGFRSYTLTECTKRHIRPTERGPGMPRPAKLWRRTGHEGWWSTIGGKKVNLGLDRGEAEKRFHQLKAAGKTAVGKLTEPSAFTVATLVNRYLADAATRVAGNTLDQYHWNLSRW